MRVIHFYEEFKSYGFLSNFAACPILLKGQLWPTSEHYYQAQKYAGTEREELIRQAPSPLNAKELTRDPAFPPRADWDAIKDRVKLYLIPGMDHCFGGEGAFAIDWLTALEEWAEKGKTPGGLSASHPAMTPGPPGAPPSPGKAFTRPVCPYPQVARYKGSGDETDAASFACVAP